MNKFRSLVIKESFYGDHYDGTVPVEVTKLPGGITREETDNTIIYHKNGKLHREDGPAWEEKWNEYKAWYFNGKKHREGAPAVYYGSEEHTPKFWYKNGKYHRLDGPAVEFEKRSKDEYWVNGKQFSKEEFYKHFADDLEENKRYNPLDTIKIDSNIRWVIEHYYGNGIITVKKLKNGGSKVTHFNKLTVYLDKNGKYHRKDGPAFINRNTGYEAWYVNGVRHRIDGPAVYYNDRTYETDEYWVKGREFSEYEFYKHFGDKEDSPVFL